MESRKLSQSTDERSEAKPSSSPFNPIKSKKIVQSISKSDSPDEIQASGLHPWSLKTPEKPTQLPRRTRNRGVALSVKEVKKVALGLQRSEREGSLDRLDLIRSSRRISSAGKQIGSGSSVSMVGKSSKSEGSTKLPEKYEILVEFFHSMESSIRLLRLKGSLCTFTNICPKIESLTDRRFSYGHLAQMKYILPDAIVTKKVLLQDERTLCMKPELQITLQSDAFKNDGKQKEGSGYLCLRKVFRERLLEFFKAHPEGDEIPEETLPEPFNKTKQNMLSSTINNLSVPVETSSDALTQPLPAVASHLSQSFQRRFSQKVSVSEENTHPNLSNISLKPSVLPVASLSLKESSSNEEVLTSAASSPLKSYSKPPTSKKSISFCDSPVHVSSFSNLASKDEETESMKNEVCSSSEIPTIQQTPAKLISTPAKLMSMTPVLQTPKRCRMSPDNDSIDLPNKFVRRPNRTRSLKFDTPVKNAEYENEMGRLSVDADISDILPERLIRSIREKERRAMEQHNAGVCQAKRRQLMIACLPKLFDMMLLIFQSIKRSVITKEELIYKIIASHCDIIDRREVEEQLKLMEELVPNWISGKVASSGDYLFCVSKNASPESVRSRLAEAE